MTVLTHEETHALSLSSEDTLEVIRETERAVIAKMNADPRTKLRAAQAHAVMPLIGPLLDAWECCSQDVRSEHPELDKQLRRINRAMKDAGKPTPD